MDVDTNNSSSAASSSSAAPRMLLLSGPNMGGKSTLLRQTCLVAIMAQVCHFKTLHIYHIIQYMICQSVRVKLAEVVNLSSRLYDMSNTKLCQS
jgi:ABC-type cobalamin/Fe3+-siderophores transport system ATPase subunit